MNTDHNPASHEHEAGPVRTEVQAKQGAGPRIMIWVLLFSLLLAIIVGGTLLSNRDELGAKSNGTPAAVQEQQAPATGAPPATGRQ
jgi:hypothetical protein